MKPEFKRGSNLSDGNKVVELLHNALNYSIYRLEGKKYAVYLSEALVEQWRLENILAPEFFENLLLKFEEGYLYISAPGYKVYTPLAGPYPDNQEEALDFARAFKEYSQRSNQKTFSNLLYIEKYDLMLPLYSADEKKETASVLIGNWLTDGLPVDATNLNKVKVMCQWLDIDDIEEILETSGIDTKNEISSCDDVVATKDKEVLADIPSYDEAFILPGREELTKFFNENIVDFLKNKEEYSRMGISSIPATLLYGKPGSGKTYAVQQLAEYLKLPYFEINSGSVASPYVHDTSKKISEIFLKAIEAAPSVLVVDEMEAYLSSRASASQDHHIEEVDEFLRNIPKAIDAEVIIFAMTNHIEMIDQAVLRKGRFDRIIEVGMPTKLEVFSALKSMLSRLPLDDNIDYDNYAEKLAGRPMSDIAFVVREAGRMAVRNKSKVIKNEFILEVIRKTLGIEDAKPSTRKIGFNV